MFDLTQVATEAKLLVFCLAKYKNNIYIFLDFLEKGCRVLNKNCMKVQEILLYAPRIAKYARLSFGKGGLHRLHWHIIFFSEELSRFMKK